MHRPFFAGLDTHPGIVEPGVLEEQVNTTLEWAWYWDDGTLYIVTSTDGVLGPDTEMREAMQTLLGSEDHMFGQLDEYLRVEWVPRKNKHFDSERGFFVA